MSAAHTPAPWHVQHPRGFVRPQVWCQQGLLFYVEQLPGGEAEAKANAAHIVHCVNAHDELVAALRFCVQYDGGECLGDHPAQLEAAHAALAKATS